MFIAWKLQLCKTEGPNPNHLEFVPRSTAHGLKLLDLASLYACIQHWCFYAFI